MNSPKQALHLKPVTGRPRIPQYLRLLWSRRYFINAESKAKAFQSSKNMLLGHAWVLLSPLLDAAVFGLIFGLLLHTSRGIDNFLPYLFVGITFFGFTNRALNGGAGLIRANRNVIRAFAFPRAALVISQTLREFYDSIPIIAITLVVVVLFPQGTGTIYATWILFPIIYFLQILFGMGLTFLSAYLTSIIPDIKTVINYFTRFWFYTSGVFFSIDRFVEHPNVITMMKLNPAYNILEMTRNVLIYGVVPNPSSWFALLAAALISLSSGFLLFWSREVKYARG
ncbi:hypothetical protein BSR29_00545 [Boudabousia liubingyangii]|uniref:Transport permease protein n=2 Tax=Boudabousia liubingyangii TaxID=1921764 RepID=A0A1Q5PQW4_9ACTO|nr:hypothetical protein BSR29_00545 [Boudabousia liubingyangii]